MSDNPCENCGLCCMHMATPPFVLLSEIPPEHAESIQLWVFSPRRTYVDEQPCVWLDQLSGKCKHYDQRPSVCREFVPGSEGCNRHRTRGGLPPIPMASTGGAQ